MGAIPADLDKQSHGAGISGYRFRPWYEDTTYVCRDCGQTFAWSAVEQLQFYEDGNGLSTSERSRCPSCHSKYIEYCRVHTARMNEAAERRRNTNSEQNGAANPGSLLSFWGNANMNTSYAIKGSRQPGIADHRRSA